MNNCNRIADLRCKEVINICDGRRLGFVNDVEIDICDGRVIAFVVPGPARFFGIFGREDDIVIPWCNIKRIGEDLILVEIELKYPEFRRKKRWFFL